MLQYGSGLSANPTVKKTSVLVASLWDTSNLYFLAQWAVTNYWPSTILAQTHCQFTQLNQQVRLVASHCSQRSYTIPHRIQGQIGNREEKVKKSAAAHSVLPSLALRIEQFKDIHKRDVTSCNLPSWSNVITVPLVCSARVLFSLLNFLCWVSN